MMMTTEYLCIFLLLLTLSMHILCIPLNEYETVVDAVQFSLHFVSFHLGDQKFLQKIETCF